MRDAASSVVLVLSAFLSLDPVPAAAQASCEDQSANKRGGWVQGTDAGGAGSPATARNKARITPILDEIAALVKAAYPDPVGSQGKIYRNYGLESFAGGNVATYEMTANFKGYGCDKRKNPAGDVTMHTETATWLYIQVNSFWTGNSKIEYPQHFLSSDGEQNLYTVQPARVLRTPSPSDPGRRAIDATVPASIAAFPNFIHEGQYDSSERSYRNREVAQVVFITPDGKPPYDPVTIGEFLDINEARLKAFIRANEQYGGMEGYQQLLTRIPALRQQYAARLGETAYIRGFTWSESQLGETQPFTTGEQGYMIARRSNRFTGTDPYRPRFITVFWRWQPEYPYSVRVHEAIRDKLDFAKLAALLTK